MTLLVSTVYATRQMKMEANKQEREYKCRHVEVSERIFGALSVMAANVHMLFLSSFCPLSVLFLFFRLPPTSSDGCRHSHIVNQLTTSYSHQDGTGTTCLDSVTGYKQVSNRPVELWCVTLCATALDCVVGKEG